MGYRIEGDGSHQHTLIWRNNTLISYENFTFRISVDECTAIVDDTIDVIDYMLLSGVYMIISGGTFANSKILFNDEMLRGVQSLTGQIRKDHHPLLGIDCIMLPNVTELDESSPSDGE